MLPCECCNQNQQHKHTVSKTKRWHVPWLSDKSAASYCSKQAGVPWVHVLSLFFALKRASLLLRATLAGPYLHFCKKDKGGGAICLVNKTPRTLSRAHTHTSSSRQEAGQEVPIWAPVVLSNNRLACRVWRVYCWTFSLLISPWRARWSFIVHFSFVLLCIVWYLICL